MKEASLPGAIIMSPFQGFLGVADGLTERGELKARVLRNDVMQPLSGLVELMEHSLG